MKLRLTSLLLVLFCCFSTWAQDIYFQTLGVNQGLSQSSAISFWQDPIGRMWIGNDALNCYNGESVTQYRISEYFPEIEDSNIHTITGNDSVMFVLAENNLVCFDLITETFRLPEIKTNRIYCDEHLVYYFSGGVFYSYCYSSEKNTAIMDFPAEITSVTSILKVADGIFWIGTSRGIYIIDINQKRIITKSLEGESITTLFRDSRNTIWLSCSSRNIYVSTMEGEIQPLRINRLTHRNTFPVEIYSINEDSKGNIWLGTLSGVYLLRVSNSMIGEAVLQNHVIPEATVFALFADRQGSMWIGPYYGDVRFYNPKTDSYNYQQVDENHPDRLHGAVVGSIAEDINNTLYIATEGSGINILKRGSNRITHLTTNDGLPTNKIRALWYDKEYHRLYISAYMHGMCYLDIATKQIHKIDNGDIVANLQHIIEEIHLYKGNLILLTQNGIFKLDRETLKITHFFEEENLREECSGIIRTIYIDNRDILWVSSYQKGLFTIDLKTRKIIKNYGDGIRKGSIIPSAIVNICGDTQRGVFMATLKSGLLYYNDATDTFTVYNEEKRDILSNLCYNITFTWYGNLIITTSKGISVLSFTEDKQVSSARHIRLSPIFPLSALSIDCGLYSMPSRDRIYIGGLYGLLTISERDLVVDDDNYNVYFSSLSVNNVQEKASSPIMEKSLHLMDKISLPYNKNTLTITYASSNYLSSHTTRYEYKLDGLDDIWTETDHKTIIYNSLRPGNYKLIVKEYNNPAKTAELSIVIRPPFWTTSPAIFLYFIIIFIILWRLVIFNRSKAILKAKLDLERREMDRIEEVNRNKLDYFINLSNEFRTPLTLILSQLDRLSHDLPSSSRSKIEKIQKQTSRLQDLISELLDFRKLEENQLKLKIKEYNLTDSVKEIYDIYSDFAAEKKISFRYKHGEEPIHAWYDKKQIQKVIYNLLAFVLREANNKTAVSISLHRKNKWIEIVITEKGEIKYNESLDYLFSVINSPSDTPPDLHQLPERGISLVFNRGILSLHKGEVMVEENRNEQKRTFTIRIQPGNSHFTEKELKDSSEEVEASPIPIPTWDKHELQQELLLSPDEGKKLSMLLVEDNDEIGNVLVEAFSMVYEVVRMQNASEAYDYAIKELPDIILSEINLPGFSGLEMTQTLKTNVKTLHIPILLMTSQPSEKQLIESIRCGAEAYIEKPFSMEILFLKCNHIVRNRKKIIQNLTSETTGSDVPELTTNSRDQEFMSMANQVIENNWNNINFDTTVWSNELGISRTKLFTQIKEITGMTPNDYILHMKMNKGASLLTEEKALTISEIAYRLGFANPAYFSKCFKKQFGITPAEYKKK